VLYHGTIAEEGGRGGGVALSVRFDEGLATGTMTQGTEVGDTVVKFSGSWEGTTFRGQTGEVMEKPTRVRWDGESFTLDFAPESAALYTCEAGGKTYFARLAVPSRLKPPPVIR
jgi:hypothetical protein